MFSIYAGNTMRTMWAVFISLKSLGINISSTVAEFDYVKDVAVVKGFREEEGNARRPFSLSKFTECSVSLDIPLLKEKNLFQ